MTIKAGDKMPEGSFTHMTKDGPQKITTEQLFARQDGGVLFGARCLYAHLRRQALAGIRGARRQDQGQGRRYHCMHGSE